MRNSILLLTNIDTGASCLRPVHRPVVEFLHPLSLPITLRGSTIRHTGLSCLTSMSVHRKYSSRPSRTGTFEGPSSVQRMQRRVSVRARWFCSRNSQNDISFRDVPPTTRFRSHLLNRICYPEKVSFLLSTTCHPVDEI